MTNPRENKPVDYSGIGQLVRGSGLFADTPPQVNRVRYSESAPTGRVEVDYVIPFRGKTPELLDDSQEQFQAFITDKCCVDAVTVESDSKEGEHWVRDIRVKFSWGSDRLTEQSLPNKSRRVDYAHIEQLMHDSRLFEDGPPQIRRFRYFESALNDRVWAVYEFQIRESTPELLDDFQEKLQGFIARKCYVEAITVESDKKEGGQWVRDIQIKFSWDSDGLMGRSPKPVGYEGIRQSIHDSGLDDSLRADGDRCPVIRIHYSISGSQAHAFFQVSISGDSRAHLDESEKKLCAHVTSEVGLHRLETPSDRGSEGNWVRTMWFVFQWQDNSLAGCRT